MILRTHETGWQKRLRRSPIGHVVWLDNRRGKHHPAEADWLCALYVIEGRHKRLIIRTWHEWHRPRKDRRTRWPHLVKALPASMRKQCV